MATRTGKTRTVELGELGRNPLCRAVAVANVVVAAAFFVSLCAWGNPVAIAVSGLVLVGLLVALERMLRASIRARRAQLRARTGPAAAADR